MLGLLGLFGLLLSGLFAEVPRTADGADDADAPPPEGAEGPPAGNMLDLIAGDSDAAEAPGSLRDTADEPATAGAQLAGSAEPAWSSDIAPPPDPPVAVIGGDEAEMIRGGGGDDTLSGGGGNDGIDGGAGDDVLDGGDGDDQVNGSVGDDLIRGGAGDDTLIGEDGADTLDGGAGNDRLAGHEGDDSLTGGAGGDTLLGGGGNDTLIAGTGDNWLAGGSGDDLLVAGDGADTLDGGAGDDTLIGGPGAAVRYLNGGTGDDLITLGGRDVGTGGEGADTFALVAEGAEAIQVMDFDAAEDSLVLVYDAAAHPAPVVTLAPGPGPQDAVLMLDGLPVAQIAGAAGLDTGLVRLVPAGAGQAA